MVGLRTPSGCRPVGIFLFTSHCIANPLHFMSNRFYTLPLLNSARQSLAALINAFANRLGSLLFLCSSMPFLTKPCHRVSLRRYGPLCFSFAARGCARLRLCFSLPSFAFATPRSALPRICYAVPGLALPLPSQAQQSYSVAQTISQTKRPLPLLRH